ncbi:MAG TPA: plasmid partitioning protein RepB [Paracoccus sp.]|nr:plasmid partitioning protein RepB [Paracoccus sp. (in: a-proteobacteria)]
MARRNIFQPPPPPSGSTPPGDKPRFPNTGAMSGVRSTLKDLSSNAVREIAPEMIEDDGPKDRLSISDADVAQLAESIRAHGQQVPIMVRPLPERPGHYRVVYGRRRLHALRLLGQPAKALVRALSDSEAVLAQGQENAQRLDPSFIEKALFARDLADGGYDAGVILDALAIDKPMLSRMNKVARGIPAEVIRRIGPAHGIGRRRWEELADTSRAQGIELAALLVGLDLPDTLPSDERFARLTQAVAKRLRQQKAEPPPALSITHADGTPLAELRESTRALTLKLSKAETPGFALWLRDNAEAELTRLYDDWRARTAD